MIETRAARRTRGLAFENGLAEVRLRESVAHAGQDELKALRVRRETSAFLGVALLGRDEVSYSSAELSLPSTALGSETTSPTQSIHA